MDVKVVRFVLSTNLCTVGIDPFVCYFSPNLGKTEPWSLIMIVVTRILVVPNPFPALHWCRQWHLLCLVARNFFSIIWFQQIMDICRPKPLGCWKVVPWWFVETMVRPVQFNVIRCWIILSDSGMIYDVTTSADLKGIGLRPRFNPVWRWMVVSWQSLWETTAFASARRHHIWATMCIWWWIYCVQSSTRILLVIVECW